MNLFNHPLTVKMYGAIVVLWEMCKKFAMMMLKITQFSIQLKFTPQEQIYPTIEKKRL